MDWVTVGTLHTEVVLDALNMATWWPRPEAVIHHSHKGWAGHSIAFGERCGAAGILRSTGLPRDWFDNAVADPSPRAFDTERYFRDDRQGSGEGARGP